VRLRSFGKSRFMFTARTVGVSRKFPVSVEPSPGVTAYMPQVTPVQPVTLLTPGTYFFRCDVHPNTMTGQFIVQ
jgi:hypothetical protein